jgi:hypothetical protein
VFPRRNGRFAARIWWATLPYWGWVGTTADEIADGAQPCPWWAHPLAWLHALAERMPGCWPVFEAPAESFPTENAVSGENGGGGNRTRVTSPAESPSEQGDPPRPSRNPR